MNHRRLDDLQRRLNDGAEGGCPQCRPIQFVEVRRLPSGEYVQTDGTPLPPLCSCKHSGIKRIEVVIG